MTVQTTNQKPGNLIIPETMQKRREKSRVEKFVKKKKKVSAEFFSIQGSQQRLL